MVTFCLLFFAAHSLAQTRIEIIPAEEKLVEKLTNFDPIKLSVKKIGSRFVLVSESQEIKDFGLDEKAANDAVRILRELKVNQFGSVAHARPSLEYWLVDGQAPRKTLSLSSFISFDLNSLKVEKSFNVWMLRDRKQMIFNFGDDQAAAEEALAICKKHKFNQLGYIGTGTPVMTYFLIDPFQAVAKKSDDPSPLEVLQSADRLGLILPDIGMVGPKMAIDARKLELVNENNDWQIRYGADILGSFSRDENTARRTMRFLQDYRVTEQVKIGKSNFPLFLSFGQPLVKVPLGYHSMSFKPGDLTVKELNGKWVIAQQNSPLFEAGDTKEEAVLLLKVIQFYRLDRVLMTGNQLKGGMRILMRDR
jgi:hypothetical protein